MEYQIEYRQVIRTVISCLRHEPQWMQLLLPSSKAYTKLIEHLLSTQANYEEDKFGAPRETVVGFARELNEKSATVNKWLREIYDDILDLNDNHPELFAKEGDIICKFQYYSRLYRTGFWFYLGVPAVPNVGDYFELFFVRALAEDYQFVVKQVSYKFDHGRMEIEIDLGQKYSEDGLYKKLLIEKARFLDLLSIGEKYGPENVLDERLRDLLKRKLL